LAGEEEGEGVADDEGLPPPPHEKNEGEEEWRKRPSLPPSTPPSPHPSCKRRRKEATGWPARSCRKVWGCVLLLEKEAIRGGRKGEAPPRGARREDKRLLRAARCDEEGGRKEGREGEMEEGREGKGVEYRSGRAQMVVSRREGGGKGGKQGI